MEILAEILIKLQKQQIQQKGTQAPSGSTDGSVENTPEGGNNIPGSGSEGTTDNEVVKNSSFSIKFVRDNEHNKNRIQVDLGSKSSQQFDPSKTGTFLKVKIYDANGSVLKSVDILGTDTGEEAKRKIEEQLNKVNSDSTDSKMRQKMKKQNNHKLKLFQMLKIVQIVQQIQQMEVLKVEVIHQIKMTNNLNTLMDNILL